MAEYDWAQNLKIASLLWKAKPHIVASPDGISAEAVSRAMVNRAYYGVLMLCKQALGVAGVEIPRGPSHKATLQALKGYGPLKVYYSKLKRMRTMREWADYTSDTDENDFLCKCARGDSHHPGYDNLEGYLSDAQEAAVRLRSIVQGSHGQK